MRTIKKRTFCGKADNSAEKRACRGKENNSREKHIFVEHIKIHKENTKFAEQTKFQ